MLRLIARLSVAFGKPQDRGENANAIGEVYRDALGDCSLEAVEHAVTVAIRQEKYFPRPAVLRRLALDFDEQRQAAGPYRPQVSDGRCPQCRTVEQWRQIRYAGAAAKELPWGERLYCDCQYPGQLRYFALADVQDLADSGDPFARNELARRAAA
jgi:hypothetical protein